MVGCPDLLTRRSICASDQNTVAHRRFSAKDSRGASCLRRRILSAVSDDGQSEHTNSEDIYYFRVVCIGRKLTGDERRVAFHERTPPCCLSVNIYLSDDVRWGVPSCLSSGCQAAAVHHTRGSVHQGLSLFHLQQAVEAVVSSAYWHQLFTSVSRVWCERHSRSSLVEEERLEEGGKREITRIDSDLPAPTQGQQGQILQRDLGQGKYQGPHRVSLFWSSQRPKCGRSLI